MKTTLLLCFFLLLLAAPAGAVNHYTFHRTTAAYVPLTGDTVLKGIPLGSGDLWSFDLAGQTVRFFNKPYALTENTRYIAFSTNGHMHIQDDSTYFIIDGLFQFLDSIDASSAVSYKTEGSGANQVFKVQWKNLRLRMGAAGNFVNMQMWLYRATGTIEMRYGPSSANNANGFSSATGPHIGLFYSDKNFTSMYEKIWVSGFPHNPDVDSAHDFAFKAMFGVPAEGTLFRFAPRSAPAGIAATAAEELQISPNPVRDELYITSVDAGTAELTDGMGRILLQRSLPAGQRSAINAGPLPTGTYFLRYTTPRGVIIKQVVKH